jgi:hypothetical protein
VTTHAIYKSQEVSWQNLRLSAQLKAAVEQLDLLVLSVAEARRNIQPSEWPEVAAKEELKRFFTTAVEEGRIPEELAPKDWSRFTDNVYRMVAARPLRAKPSEIPELVSQAMDAHLQELGPDKIPRSVSLWQFAFVSLLRFGTMKQVPEATWPLITPELEELFPGVRELQPRFDYS